MKSLSLKRQTGFTRMELVVVCAIVLVLLSMLLPAMYKTKSKAQRIWCVNNLKQLGMADRLWANDHPNILSALAARTNAGPYCWAFYAALGEYSGQSPKVFVCPADERKAAAYFTKGGRTNGDGVGLFKDNSTVSYFVNPDANGMFPQSIAFGDRNLGAGIIPRNDYGYSPSNGTGNDVVINGPVCWSLTMHSAANTAGAGNILLGDGSACQVSSKMLNQNWLTNSMNTSTNHPGLRLVFP